MNLIYKVYSTIDTDANSKIIYIKQSNKEYSKLFAPIVFIQYLEQYTDPRNPNYYNKTIINIDIFIKELEIEQIHHQYWRALPEGKYKLLSFNDVLDLYNEYNHFTKYNYSFLFTKPVFTFKDGNKALTTFLDLLQLIITKWDDWN
jgi:hypothetical protein